MSMPLPPTDAALARIADNPNLPSPPAVALQVLEKASRPDCTMAEIARVIGLDPALCGKLLQLVNSALCGVPRSVTSITRALPLLGLQRVRSLVLSLSLPALKGRAMAGPVVQDFWRGSVAAAIVARELAAWQGLPDPESELASALLCDLGMLAMSEVFGRPYLDLLARPPSELARRQCALESEAWGVHHAEVSAYLLRRWHLPAELTEAVRHHHAPEGAAGLPTPVPERAWLLHFAALLGRLQVLPGDPLLTHEALALGHDRFGMDEEGVRKFARPLGEKVQALASVMDVDIGTCHDFAGVFACATEQLTQLALQTSLDNIRIQAEKEEAERERLRAEEALRRSEEQFRQAQKMEAVGRLAGGVAHDFNNMLTVINGYAELVSGMMPPNTPARGMVEQIRKAGERAAGLTSQLLAFSRKQLLAPAVLDLNQVIGNLDKMIRRLIGEDVNLVNDLAPNLFPVKADPVQIDQVLLNLIVNARDAMPGGGNITIETSNIVIQGGAAGPPPGNYVRLAVRDTGVGMDEAVKSHIFEPFFTTKEAGKGTGLGLATVYGIVKQSGGHIEVESAPGRGTTFEIYLPQAAVSVDQPPARAPAAAPPAGTETVLVAEDEAAVRTFVCEALRQAGYAVLEACHGADAVEVSRGHAGPIHLLLTDTVMPHLSGSQVAQALTGSRPALRVLYTSGYPDDAILRHGVLRAGIPFLQKPFTTEALVRKVRDVLNVP